MVTLWYVLVEHHDLNGCPIVSGPYDDVTYAHDVVRGLIAAANDNSRDVSAFVVHGDDGYVIPTKRRRRGR